MGIAAAAVVGGGMVVSSAIGASAAGDAADAVRAGTDAATAEQRRQFDVTQEQMAPWREAGLRGLTTYEDMLKGYGDAEGMIKSNVPGAFSFTGEDFQKYQDPGYQFRLAEGERALNRGAARTGAMASGSRYRGLMDLGQQMASQEFAAARSRAYQDYASGVASEQEQYQRSLGQYGRQYVDPLNRYAALSGIGQSTTAGLGQLRSSMADQISQNTMAGANAQAAGIMGQARSWQQGISSLGNLAGMYYGGGFGGGGGNAVSGGAGGYLGAQGNWAGLGYGGY